MIRGWQRAMGLAAMLIGSAHYLSYGADRVPAAEEAELLARRLVEENLELQADIAQLRAERDGLLARLADEQYASDRLQVVPERLSEVGQAQGSVSLAGWSVLEANRELGLVAVRAGARDGLRSGLMLAVIRDGGLVARVKIVEVRERIAAGHIEALAEGRFPQEGDRVVVWRSRRE